MDVPVLRDLVGILKDGGAYAGWALFVVMWYYERRANRKSSSDVLEIVVMKVRNDVELEKTIEALTGGIDSLGMKVDVIGNDVKGLGKRIRSFFKKHDEKACQKED